MTCASFFPPRTFNPSPSSGRVHGLKESTHHPPGTRRTPSHHKLDQHSRIASAQSNIPHSLLTSSSFKRRGSDSEMRLRGFDSALFGPNDSTYTISLPERAGPVHAKVRCTMGPTNARAVISPAQSNLHDVRFDRVSSALGVYISNVERAKRPRSFKISFVINSS